MQPWRKRVRVEHAHDVAKTPHAGFENLTGIQTLSILELALLLQRLITYYASDDRNVTIAVRLCDASSDAMSNHAPRM